jgi:hypothetical protein
MSDWLVEFGDYMLDEVKNDKKEVEDDGDGLF